MCALVLYKKQMECTIAKCLRTIDIKVREWIWIPAPVLTRMWPYVTKLLCLYFIIYKMEVIRGVLWRLNESVFEKSSALCKTSCYHHHHCDPHHNHYFTGRDTEKTWGRKTNNNACHCACRKTFCSKCRESVGWLKGSPQYKHGAVPSAYGWNSLDGHSQGHTWG